MPSGPRSRRLPEPWIFFVDRSLGGKVVAETLRAAGERVEVHDDHFPKGATDETWLAEVGAKGWVILSKDDRIRRNPIERQALLASGVAAFFLGRSDLRGDQMASAFLSALPAMKKSLRRFAVPFIAGVTQAGEVHVFEADGERHAPPKRVKPPKAGPSRD